MDYNGNNTTSDLMIISSSALTTKTDYELSFDIYMTVSTRITIVLGDLTYISQNGGTYSGDEVNTGRDWTGNIDHFSNEVFVTNNWFNFKFIKEGDSCYFVINGYTSETISIPSDMVCKLGIRTWYQTKDIYIKNIKIKRL